MRGFAAAVFALTAVFAMPFATQAQSWYGADWDHYPWGTFEERGRRGAQVCNATDEGGGQISCLRLMCRPGEPLVFIHYQSGDPTGPRNLILTIDDAVRIRMTLFGNDHDFDGYAQVIHPRAHGLLLSALRSGRWVTAQEEGATWIERYRLTGSARMIDHAMRVCPVLHPDSPVTVSPPLALAPAAAPPPHGASAPGSLAALPTFPAPPAAPVSLPALTTPPDDGRLDALSLRDQILDRRMTWGDGSTAVTFRPGGTFEGVQNGHAVTGSWQMVTDGRICWTDGSTNGCFRFLRRAGALALRLENPAGSHDLGPLRFE